MNEFYYDNDYDDYFDDEEFDNTFGEFKDKLKASLVPEIKSELEELRRKVAEMTPIYEEYQKKVAELNAKMRSLEYEVKQKRLSEILKDFSVEIFAVRNEQRAKEKCDKCDERRYIHYTSPLGHPQTELCDCARKEVWFGIQSFAWEYTSIEYRPIQWWYKVERDGMTIWRECVRELSDDKPFEQLCKEKEIGTYGNFVFFRSKDKAQAFADYLNDKYQKGELVLKK